MSLHEDTGRRKKVDPLVKHVRRPSDSNEATARPLLQEDALACSLTSRGEEPMHLVAEMVDNAPDLVLHLNGSTAKWSDPAASALSGRVHKEQGVDLRPSSAQRLRCVAVAHSIEWEGWH